MVLLLTPRLFVNTIQPLSPRTQPVMKVGEIIHKVEKLGKIRREPGLMLVLTTMGTLLKKTSGHMTKVSRQEDGTTRNINSKIGVRQRILLL